MTRGVHVGLDVGSTQTKAVAYDARGALLCEHSVGTTWRTSPTGGTETSGTDLLAGALTAVHGLLDRLDGSALQVLSMGVTGMAESGVLLGRDGAEATPVVAWYDPRGGDEVAALSSASRDAFTAATGLRADSQPSVATLAWGAGHGWDLTPSSTWLSVPELIVAALGGERVAEPSLASRTGLFDTSRGVPSDDVADALGLPRTLLPPLRSAGTSAGTVTSPDADPRLRGAVLSVAGHDHPVAAIGAGATGPDQLFNGAGTADVLLRSVGVPVTDIDRTALAASGVSVGWHVLDGVHAVLGGVSAGVVLRRVLSLADAVDGARLAMLDAAAAGVARPVQGISVRAGGRGGEDVQIVMDREVGPSELLAAALDHVGDQTASLIALVESVVGPYSTAVCSGGWLRLASVRAVKREVIPRLELSDVVLPGCRGAAVLGALAATGAEDQRGLVALLDHWAPALIGDSSDPSTRSTDTKD